MYNKGIGRTRKNVGLYKISIPTGNSRLIPHKDISVVLFYIIFGLLVLITFTQIVMVHNKHKSTVKVHNTLRQELRAMDSALKRITIDRSIPNHLQHRNRILNQINAKRISWLIAQASQDFINIQVDNATTENRTFLMANESIVKDFCLGVPPGLVGKVFTATDHSHSFTMPEIIHQNPDVQEGGFWKPTDCVARHSVAIIIPFRDREKHLGQLLSHLHPILQRQQLEYGIFVSEQFGGETFNKGVLMNVAFLEALKMRVFDCFVFHDVDLVPEDDRNMYSCPSFPRHMSVAIDKHNYKLPYKELVGGVLNMPREFFFRVNGYSNLYWGWGAEDDDMYYRLRYFGLNVIRPPETIARYKMLDHAKRQATDWNKRKKLLYSGNRRYHSDGLNSLSYQLKYIHQHPLYTHLMVDVGKKPHGF